MDTLDTTKPLEGFLAAQGIGDAGGRLTMAPLGDGHSNLTYLLDLGGDRVVLRRPPEGPLPPSAHDVIREANLLRALGAAGLRVPRVLASRDDDALLGAPFFVMELIEGRILTTEPPESVGGEAERARLGREVVENLVEIHAVDPAAETLARFGRPDGFLERQIRRFGGLLDGNATRPLPDLDWVRGWLGENLPASPPAAIVHGDYRLGNLMFDPREPRLLATLDWELTTIGDPLADLGYLMASWARSDDPPNPVNELSTVVDAAGTPTAEELAALYFELSGRAPADMRWYRALALFRAAVFLEGSYKRFQAGTTDDAWFASLERGVPEFGRLARRIAETG
jgi:aminoglycoside phosphotransferase (APT) family kinase protein